MLAEIVDAGKYAPYVWGSFGLAVLIYGWNLLAPRWRRAEVLRTLTEDR